MSGSIRSAGRSCDSSHGAGSQAAVLKRFSIVLISSALLLSFRVAATGPSRVPSPGENQPGCALAFIVNKSNPVENMTYPEVRKIFLGGRERWPNGRKVTVVMQEEGQEERQAVLRLVYRMSESEYKRYALHAAYAGNPEGAPRLLSTPTGVIKFVSFVPGAIGYVCAGEVDDSVKALKIDGRVPEDPRYKVAVKVP